MPMIGRQQMVGLANPPPKSPLWSWLLPDGEEGTGKLADSACITMLAAPWRPLALGTRVPASPTGGLAPWGAGATGTPELSTGEVVSPIGEALPKGLEAPELQAGDRQGEVTACSCGISPAS